MGNELSLFLSFPVATQHASDHQSATQLSLHRDFIMLLPVTCKLGRKPATILQASSQMNTSGVSPCEHLLE
eukprot:6014693-Amphidinium_carterae.1